MNYLNILFLAILISLASSTSAAIDGQKLFKSKCNTCHRIDQRSTGPKLQGVKAKWTEAGESEFLYLWVQNSSDLIASGKSSMANAIRGYSEQNMPSQQLTSEEIDAVFEFVDDWSPPKKEELNISEKSQKEDLYPIFLVLLITGLLFLIIVIVISNVLIRLLKERVSLRNVKKEPKATRLLGLIFILLCLLQFIGIFDVSSTQSNTNPRWIAVSCEHIFALLTIDIMLFFVILFIRNQFSKISLILN